MNTEQFLTKILAAKGLKVIAELTPDKRWRHTFCKHTTVAAKIAQKLDERGRTVYHACATFKTDANRKQENAGWMRSFWIDADVGEGRPDKYGTQKEAVLDIGRVCKELGLPLPLIVKSGGGLHAYWVLDDDVPSELWVPTAERFKAALASLGFRQDTHRTADSASVLRPVGTHWRKEGEREVSVVRDMEPMPFEDFVAAMATYEAKTGTSPAADFDGIDNDDLGGPREYPPSSALQIIKFCPTLAHVADKRGDVDEPLWRGMLGIVKHCVEGDELGHEWSKGYEGYSEKETQSKIDRWGAAPTTCQYFRAAAGNQCAGCTRAVTSPVLLGFLDEVDPPKVDAGDSEGDGHSEGGAGSGEQTIPYWPSGFNYTEGIGIQAAIKDDQGVVHWVPFCETLFYAERRVRGEDGVWYLDIRHYTKDKRWRSFQLPCELIGSQYGLAPFLASHEVFVTGKNGVNYAKALAREYALTLQAHSIEQVTYKQFGWEDEGTAFILGNKRIRSSGTDTILAGSDIKSAAWDTDFGTKGSIEDWVRLVDEVYNREGAEAFQFVIAAAFAAPLVHIAGVNNWNGIPIALTGETGIGKSTICKVATSIYGHPDFLFRDAGGQGTTLHALVARIGLLRHLPIVFDEMTKREDHEVQNLLFALSNGQPKDRLTSSGTFASKVAKWQTISFITSNKNLTELIGNYEQAQVADAAQIRLFEIALEKDRNREVWGDINALDVIEHKLLKENYGHIGREWLRYVIDNRAKLGEEIRNARAKYNADSVDGARERFYRDLVATTLVALKHIVRLGWVGFDLAGVGKWAKRNIERLRIRRMENNTTDDLINDFIMSLQGKTIYTKRFADGRTKELVEAPMLDLRGQTPVARVAMDDKKFLVARSYLNSWCDENKISPTWLLGEMRAKELVLYHRDGSGIKYARRERLVKGTTLPGTHTYVIELVFDKVMLGKAPQVDGDDKVVQLHAGAE